ncbi:acetate--CoA ligase family protein [Nocardia vaccinii]|uniref:acetate--CoA ligase family protein n=1 Tax=Nocardia vaccinii TaxID=1822 RepID=UPI000A041759|nr:acetate--CoA ligase family protein [Nocardia vaccinii]
MLEDLFSPSSVCVIGASSDPEKLSGRALTRLLQHPFTGEIYAVNPNHDRVGGITAYRDVAAIGKAVDVALILLPALRVPDAVRECGEAGVKFAVICSSGFSEDAASSHLAGELDKAAKESGVRIVGPNCEGIWSVPENLALTFGSAANRARLLSGPVSVISQSGSIGGACLRQLQDREIGCRYFVSTGNEQDLTTLDYLEYMIDEGSSSVIALFVEALSDGVRLRELGARAAARGIRLVALCAGTSALGKQATATHTGRLSAPSFVYTQVLRRTGIVQVGSIADLIMAAEVASVAPRVRPRGQDRQSGGVSVIALSGGSRALLADSAEERGVPMASFDAQSETRLEEVIPRFGYHKNPIDVTGEVVGRPQMLEEVMGIVGADENTDSIIVQYANGAEKILRQHIPTIVDHSDLHYRKPLIISTLGRIDDELRRSLTSNGLLHAEDPAEAIKIAGWLYDWADNASNLSEHGYPGTVAQASPATVPADWLASMQMLTNIAIRTPRWFMWKGDPDHPELTNLTYPLVLKASPDVAEHKTELGLVYVGLDSPQRLQEAWSRYSEIVGAGKPCIVQEMAIGDVEMLLAARWDSDFGPLLVIGAGGILTEFLQDIAVLPIPSTKEQIRNALSELRVWQLLSGYRNAPPCDIDSLVDSAAALADHFYKIGGPGAEIEINPLIVGAQGATAVDVLTVSRAHESNGISDLEDSTELVRRSC